MRNFRITKGGSLFGGYYTVKADDFKESEGAVLFTNKEGQTVARFKDAEISHVYEIDPEAEALQKVIGGLKAEIEDLRSEAKSLRSEKTLLEKKLKDAYAEEDRLKAELAKTCSNEQELF